MFVCFLFNMNWFYLDKDPTQQISGYLLPAHNFTNCTPTLLQGVMKLNKLTIQVDSQILWPRQSKISRISFESVVYPVASGHKELLYSLYPHFLLVEQNHIKCLRMLSTLWMSYTYFCLMDFSWFYHLGRLCMSFLYIFYGTKINHKI